MSDTSAPQTGSASNGAAVPPPLFYKQPEPVLPGAHRDFKIRPENDFAFAANANSVPLTIPEFSFVARHYPIVFLGPELVPTGVLGLSAEKNLFVNAKGEWDNDIYIPAFVRRYPFILMTNPGTDERMHLGVDAAGRSSKPNARALFEEEKETEMLKATVGFVEQFHGAYQLTRQFSKALVEAKITEETGIDMQTPAGSKIQLGPFYAVSEEKFRNLPDATVLEWHKLGFLHSIYFHLQSLTTWPTLMQRIDRKIAA